MFFLFDSKNQWWIKPVAAKISRPSSCINGATGVKLLNVGEKIMAVPATIFFVCIFRTPYNIVCVRVYGSVYFCSRAYTLSFPTRFAIMLLKYAALYSSKVISSIVWVLFKWDSCQIRKSRLAFLCHVSVKSPSFRNWYPSIREREEELWNHPFGLSVRLILFHMRKRLNERYPITDFSRFHS